MENILSLLIWIPILGAIVVAFLPRDNENLVRYTSAAVTGLQFVVAIVLWRKFDPLNGSMQFMERYEWIPSLNISYILGVDGLSLPMVLLTAMLFFIGVFVSWNIKKAVKGYFALYLLLNAGVVEQHYLNEHQNMNQDVVGLVFLKAYQMMQLKLHKILLTE